MQGTGGKHESQFSMSSQRGLHDSLKENIFIENRGRGRTTLTGDYTSNQSVPSIPYTTLVSAARPAPITIALATAFRKKRQNKTSNKC